MDTSISRSWLKFLGSLNEAQVRWCAAVKSLELGRGGVTRVHKATGLSQTTIKKGLRELTGPGQLPGWDRVRREGGGRKQVEETQPALVRDLQRLVEHNTCGNNMSALRWTAKSTRVLATALRRRGHNVSPRSVARLLRDLDYSLQLNQKSIEGSDHPDRDAQFRYINEQVSNFQSSGSPVISVDTKKKELIGNFKNAGRTYRRKGTPRKVNVYDFRTEDVEVGIPYGLYDVQRNQGMVNVGTSHDTAEFAVESIRQWWRRLGKRHYPKSRHLLVCADGGGSNGSRIRAWKLHLQALADEIGLEITVCHYPPGTSKWNKIEHRMFSFISLNWRGRPLETHQTMIMLIANTTNSSGLRIDARLDKKEYKTGVKVTAEEVKGINLRRHALHPLWNYTIGPRVENVTQSSGAKS